MKYDKTAVIALGASIAVIAGYFYLKSNEKKPQTPAPTGGSNVGATNPAAAAWRPISSGQFVRGKRYRVRLPWNVGASPEMDALEQLERNSQVIRYGGYTPIPNDWPEVNPAAVDGHHEFTAASDLQIARLPDGVRVWEHV